MLNRLPIYFAQLNPRNSSGKLKNKIRHYYILCAYQKNLQETSIKV